MKFEKEFMKELAFNEYDDHKVEVIYTKMVDQRRWVTAYEMVFKYRGSFYITGYDLPSTEDNEPEPFEYDCDDNGLIECDEVFPIEKTITIYETKK